MAAGVLLNSGLWVGGYDLQGDTNALSLVFGAEALDRTTFGDSTRDRVAGLKSIEVNHEGLFNPENADQALFGKIGLSDELMTIAPSAREAGDLAYFFRSLLSEYEPGGQVGDLMAFRVSGEAAQAPLVRGTILHRVAGATTSANGAGQNLGAVGAPQFLYAGLHVLAVSGTSPTLDVTIESDAADNFAGAETTRITFGQKTAIGAEFATPVAGAITDAWWRVAFTIGGTSPSFDFIVVMGIQ